MFVVLKIEGFEGFEDSKTDTFFNHLMPEKCFVCRDILMVIECRGKGWLHERSARKTGQQS